MVAVSSDELRERSTPNDTLDDEVSRQCETNRLKSIARRIWEYKHRIMGLGLVGLSWYNWIPALKAFAERYGNDISGVFGA
jgi:predicted alpha-1,6-mannanase (GH76 family)